MGKVKGYYLNHIEDNFDPYEGLSKEEIELYNSVPPCSSMTPVESDEGDNCSHGNSWHSNCSDCDTEIDLNRDVPNIVWEPEYMEER